jgi:hypothetical protein
MMTVPLINDCPRIESLHYEPLQTLHGVMYARRFHKISQRLYPNVITRSYWLDKRGLEKGLRYLPLLGVMRRKYLF